RAAEQALRQGVAELDQRQGFRGPLRTLGGRERKELLREVAESRGRNDAPLPEVGTILEVVVVPSADGAVRRRDGGVSVRWAGGGSVVSRAGLEWAAKTGYDPSVGDVLEAKVVAGPGGHPALELSGGNGTQGALVTLVPSTGDVKAVVGGLDFNQSQ